MTDKQVWMSIYDIQPTESFWDTVDDTQLYTKDARIWSKQELIDDIRANGVKYQLNVDREGNIKNGNMRYWACRYLLEVEGDTRFLFLPVQRNYAAGSFNEEFTFRMDETQAIIEAKSLNNTFLLQYNIPKKALKKAMRKLRQGTRFHYDRIMDNVGNAVTLDIHKLWVLHMRELTIPHATEFPIHEIDPIDEFRMARFWDVQRSMWAVLLQPHPGNKESMVAMGIPNRSEPVEIMTTGTEEEIIKFKEWWRDKRKERGSKSSLEKPDYRQEMIQSEVSD